MTEEFVLGELERLEYSVRHKGIGDLNLKGVMNPKIMKKYFNTVNIKTVEGLKLRYPREMNGTQVKIIPIENSQSSNIIIEGIHIIEGK